jgi:hypothetical protein
VGVAHDAFISYSKHDKPIADAVCATLESRGIRCWCAPRDVTPGSDWGESIVRAIRTCRIMVLVFSSNSNNSPQVRREVQQAFEHGLTVIPLRVEDIAPVEGLEYYIGPVHWLDAITPPLGRHLQTLAGQVQVLLKSSDKGPRPTLRTEGGKGEARETTERTVRHPANIFAWSSVIFSVLYGILGIGELLRFGMSGNRFLLVSFFGVSVLYGAAAWAGFEMRRLRNYWLVLAGCVAFLAASISLILIPSPIAIWAMRVLRRPEVKAAFNRPGTQLGVDRTRNWN